jgi:hypothetical protein
MKKVKLGKMGEQGDRLSWWRLNHLCFGALKGDLGCEPGLGVGIAMDEQNSGWLNLITGPTQDVLAGGVGGKIKITDLTTNGDRTGIAPRHLASLARFSEKTRWRAWICVTDKKD